MGIQWHASLIGRELGMELGSKHIRFHTYSLHIYVCYIMYGVICMCLPIICNINSYGCVCVTIFSRCD